MALSARTLQRRLTEDGVRSRILVDDARSDAAAGFSRIQARD
jgi:hypothetical protein